MDNPNTMYGQNFDFDLYASGENALIKENGAIMITNLYMDASKTSVQNNNITYEYAKGVSLMSDVDGNIRYYGKNPSNYIYFNCDNYSTPSSDTCERWRIIGVFDGNLKIIREEALGNYSWDTSTSEINSGYGINQWGESFYNSDSSTYYGADLMKLLNPGYEGNQDLDADENTITINNSLYYNADDGYCYNGESNTYTSCDFTSAGLKNDITKDMITDTLYYLGAYHSTDVFLDEIYEQERGILTGISSNDNVNRTTTWTGKVALPYLSDYGYASDLSVCQATLSNYKNDINCTSTNYLASIFSSSSYNWLLTANSTDSSEILFFDSVYSASGAGAVVPVLSLKKEIIISGGKGTFEEPYQIEDVKYVSVTDIYDSTNEVEEKLHIGDFVNYDAGTWTQEEIDSIQVGLKDSLVSANNSLELPTVAYQFGGFQVGTSRNATSKVATFSSLGTVEYISNKKTGKPIFGWRVFDIDDSTGEVTLISAGNPEAFYQTDASDAGYSTPYIFSGTIHSSWGAENAAKYQKRNWDPYINETQGATSVYILSKENLETWYKKHIGVSADLWTIAQFQKIYSYPRLHNIIDNYSFWWLSSTKAAAGPHFVQGDSARRLRGGNSVALGVRINIVLSSKAKFSEVRTGTITLTSDHLTSYGGDQVYNVWNLENLES